MNVNGREIVKLELGDIFAHNEASLPWEDFVAAVRGAVSGFEIIEDQANNRLILRKK